MLAVAGSALADEPPAEEAPSITSASSTTFTENTAGTFTVTATGVPTPTITESGALPSGVTFSEGVLSGTPTQDGVYPISFDAGNGVGSDSVQSFTLTVDSAPNITSANNTTFTEGTPGSFTVTATGTPSPTITESGALPSGVTFSGGVLSGTPTQDGVYPISFDAGNGVGSDSVQSFTLTVDSAPNITSANNTTFTEGTPGSFTVTATGTPAPSITESGALPSGVTFSGGVLSGTPTVTGTFTVSFTATNSTGFTVQNFTLTVNSKPAITSANKATFTQGSAGSFTVTATGSPTPTIAESGALPTGVTFSGGVLSGTPTQNGVYSITFTATNGVGSGASQTFTLTVNGPPAFTSSSKIALTQGVTTSFTVTATGTPAPTITAWGNLPIGIFYSKGVLSGTPDIQGTYEVEFTATNASGSSYQLATITVTGLQITTASLPAATIGTPYSETLTAANGKPPYIWELSGGALPKGLKLSKAGVISGTPTAKAVTHPLQVTVKDSSKTDPQTASEIYTLVVSPAAAAQAKPRAVTRHHGTKKA